VHNIKSADKHARMPGSDHGHRGTVATKVIPDEPRHVAGEPLVKVKSKKNRHEGASSSSSSSDDGRRDHAKIKVEKHNDGTTVPKIKTTEEHGHAGTTANPLTKLKAKKNRHEGASSSSSSSDDGRKDHAKIKTTHEHGHAGTTANPLTKLKAKKHRHDAASSSSSSDDGTRDRHQVKVEKHKYDNGTALPKIKTTEEHGHAGTTANPLTKLKAKKQRHAGASSSSSSSSSDDGRRNRHQAKHFDDVFDDGTTAGLPRIKTDETYKSKMLAEPGHGPNPDLSVPKIHSADSTTTTANPNKVHTGVSNHKHY